MVLAAATTRVTSVEALLMKSVRATATCLTSTTRSHSPTSPSATNRRCTLRDVVVASEAIVGEVISRLALATFLPHEGLRDLTS